MSVEDDSMSLPSSSGTLDRFVDKTDQREECLLNKKLAEAIYSSGCPFSMVSDPSWKEFFACIRPSFKLPSRKDIAGKYLDMQFQEIESEIWTKIKSANSLALQCDGWSNIRNEAIINFIVTTPTPVLLKTMATGTERHTGEYIAQELLNCISKIGANKTIGILSDNASAMEKAKRIVVEQFPYITAYSCVTHTLNLFIGDIMKLPSLSSLEGSCKQIIKEIIGSHINLAALTKIQTEKYGRQRALKLPVKTRWGSILHCIDSLISSKKALQILVVSEESYSVKLTKSVRDFILDNDIFWVRLEKTKKILVPIVKWITILESDKLTMSKVCVAVKEIEECLIANLEELPIKSNEEKELITSFENRKTILLKPIHLAANLLDPNHFGASLSNSQHVEAISCIDNLISDHPLFVENKEKISLELANYLGKHELWGMEFVWNTGRIADPIAWWRGICSRTHLKDVSISILGLPASSAATERSFSRYAFLHNKRRNKLTTERAGKLVFVSTNKKLLAESTLNAATGKPEPIALPMSSNPGSSREYASSSSDDEETCSVHSTTSCETETFPDAND